MLGIVDVLMGLFAFLLAYEAKILNLISEDSYMKYGQLVFVILTLCLVLVAVFKYIFEPITFKYRKTNKNLCIAVSHYRDFLGNKLKCKLKNKFSSIGLKCGYRITVYLYAEDMFFSISKIL